MTGAERSWASHYEINDVVRYARGSKAVGIEAAADTSVVAIDPGANLLTVEKANQDLARYLDAYIAGIEEWEASLFQSPDKTHKHTGQAISRRDMLRVVKERCIAAGLSETFCNHTSRGTGMTGFLSNGGSIEAAQEIANHTDPRTTKLHDRRKDLAQLSEIERRIAFEQKLRCRLGATFALSQRVANGIAGQQCVEHAPDPCGHVYPRPVADFFCWPDRRSEANTIMRLPGNPCRLREQ
jgi:hypothetical protein